MKNDVVAYTVSACFGKKNVFRACQLRSDFCNSLDLIVGSISFNKHHGIFIFNQAMFYCFNLSGCTPKDDWVYYTFLCFDITSPSGVASSPAGPAVDHAKNGAPEMFFKKLNRAHQCFVVVLNGA